MPLGHLRPPRGLSQCLPTLGVKKHFSMPGLSPLVSPAPFPSSGSCRAQPGRLSACSAPAFPCSTHLSPPFLQLFLQSLSGSFTAFPCGRAHSRTQVWGEARPQQVPFTHAAAYFCISPYLQAVHKTHFKFLQITICNAITNFIFHSNII